MRSLGTLFSLLLVAGIGFALWWSDRRDASVVEELGGVLPTQAFGGHLLSEAVGIDFRSGADRPMVELRRDDTLRWQIEEPIRDLADADRVRALVQVYDSIELIPVYESDEITPELLEQTGLDAPRAELSGRWADGHQVTLRIGGKGLFGDDVWVGRDDRILRGDRALVSALQATTDDWRESFVFANEESTAQRVTLTRRTVVGAKDFERLVFQRRADGAWALLEPMSLRMDQERARTYVGTLLSLEVARFLGGRPSEGLAPLDPEAPPDIMLEVRGSLGEERAELITIQDGFVGHVPGRRLWFRMTKADWRRVFDVPLQNLRSQLVFDFGLTQVSRLVLTPPAGGEVAEFERDGPRGAFRLVRPVASAVEPTAMAELVSALRSMVVQRFVADDVSDFAPFGLQPEASWTVELDRGRGYQAGGFRIGGVADDQTSVYLRRLDEPHVVAVPRDRVDRIERPWTDFVDLQIFKLAEASGLRGVLVRDGAGVERRLVPAPGNFWRWADAAADAPIDSRLVETVERLFDLRGRRVAAAEQLLGAEGGALAEPDFVIELIGSAGGAIARLEFHDGVGGGEPDALWCQTRAAPGLVRMLGVLDADAVRALVR